MNKPLFILILSFSFLLGCGQEEEKELEAEVLRGISLEEDNSFQINPVKKDSVQVIDKSEMLPGSDPGWNGLEDFVVINENPAIVETPIGLNESSSLPEGFENFITEIDSFFYPIEKAEFEPMVSDNESYIIDGIGDSILSGQKFIQAPKKEPLYNGVITPIELPGFQNDLNLSVRKLALRSGVPSSQFNDVYIDSRGLIWFSFNWSGFGVYNGRYLTTYGPEQGYPEQIWEIDEDSKGRIWILSDKKIMRYDGEALESWAENYSWGAMAFRHSFEDDDGSRWVQSFKGIYKIEDDSIITHFSTNEGLFDEVTIGKASVKKDEVFLISWNKIGILNTANNTCADLSKELPETFTYFRGMTSDEDGNIWFTSPMNGIFKYDGSYFINYRINTDLTSTEVILSDGNGDFWIGGRNCVFKWNEDTHIQEVYTENRGFRDRYYGDFIKDPSGNIWISGITGCYKINSNTGRLKTEHNLKVFKDYMKFGVSDVLEVENGNLWFGLYGWNPEKRTEFAMEGKNGGIPVMGFVESSDMAMNGNKWFATYADSYWINSDNSTLYTFAESGGAFTKSLNKPYPAFSDILIKNDTTVYYGSHYGLFKYNVNQNKISRLSKSEGMLTSSVSDMAFFNDYLYCGTPGKGLMQLDFENNRVKALTEEEGLSGNRVIQLMNTSNNTLWVGTAKGGINIITEDSLIYLNAESGLLSNQITSMFEDNDGDIWVTQMMPNSDLNIIQYIQTNGSSYPKDFEIHTFNADDGLDLGMIGVRSGYCTSDNTLIWGSSFGVFTLDKNTLHIADTTSDVAISHLAINQDQPDFNGNKEYDGIEYSLPKPFSHLPQNLKLDSDKDHLTFYFSHIDWISPHKVVFSHRLKTINESWSNPMPDAYADYRNLPYGKHTFEVKAMGESGEWSEITSFDFVIHPPWYHTLWARILYVILGLSLVYYVIQLRTRRLKQRQVELEHEIEEATIEIRNQKDEISEQHKEIKDSIVYAQRIQSAILPPLNLVQEYIPQAFILYKPKDIVAGDFYWFSPLEKGALIAAADCTGHGVPGAMVSVLCNGALNRAVREFGLSEPGQILTKTRDIVIEEFEKSEEEVKDGMDIALCSLESVDANSAKLKYAGAHNPLWIIRKGAEEVEEIKADKQPIGRFESHDPFKTHEVELNEGDTFYVFSDGFADQFGGEKGKKFKSANFKRLLLSIQDKAIPEQLSMVDKAFESWRGHLEQLDDVCVIGVRI